MLKAWHRIRRWWLHRQAKVHIVSFPKCGRTWLVLLVAKAVEFHFKVSTRNPLKLRRYAGRVPRFPLILQHHDGGPEFLRPEEISQDKSGYAGRKVVFLVRDPRDVLVSSYYQKTKRNINYSGSLDDYVYEPVGSLDSIIEFYNIWARNRHVPADFLLLTYEAMQEDPARELRRTLDFIGMPNIGDAAIQQAVEFCQFDNMRRLELSNQYKTGALSARNPADQSTYKTREGRIGGYRDELQQREIAYMDERIAAHLDPLFDRYRISASDADSPRASEDPGTA